MANTREHCLPNSAMEIVEGRFVVGMFNTAAAYSCV